MIGYLRGGGGGGGVGMDGTILCARDYLLYATRKERSISFSIINPLGTKLVWSRWLDIGLSSFLRVNGPLLSP